MFKSIQQLNIYWSHARRFFQNIILYDLAYNVDIDHKIFPSRFL